MISELSRTDISPLSSRIFSTSHYNLQTWLLSTSIALQMLSKTIINHATSTFSLLEYTETGPRIYTNPLHRQNSIKGRSAGGRGGAYNDSLNHASRVPKIVPMVARPGTAEDLSSL